MLIDRRHCELGRVVLNTRGTVQTGISELQFSRSHVDASFGLLPYRSWRRRPGRPGIKLSDHLRAGHPLHYLPTVILIVILIIIGIPSPTRSFTLGLNPSFSANPPYRSLPFFSFRFHYMDFPDCLLLLLSISVFLLFSFFLFLHFLVVCPVR